MEKIITVLILIFLSVMAFADKSVSELNPNFKDMMNQALKGINTYPNEYRDVPKPFSLFFFGDVHADNVELERYCEFYKENRSYFDDSFCAGDLVLGAATDDFTYWNQVKGAENIMFVMGNHDIAYTNPETKKYVYLTDKEAYDRYFAPNVKNWNCNIEEGKSYFYKDYPEKKIRFIGINCMSNGEEMKTQLEWFKNTLLEARELGFTVIAGVHVPPVIMPVSIKSNWCEFDRDENDYIPYCTPFLQAVKEFKKKGGLFALWLAGHTHSDYLYVSKQFPDQLIMVVGETHRGGGAVYSQVTRTDGTSSQDLANAIIVDTSSKTLKAIRIGVHYDRYLRPINALSINYETMQVITEW